MRIFRCKHCGQIIVMAKDTGVIPSCCNEEMELLKANTSDGAFEKHVPVVELVSEENKIKVAVGSVAHPMIEAHFIEFILVETKKGFQLKHLLPNEEPKACFHICKKDELVNVYAYCNLHGLWKA